MLSSPINSPISPNKSTLFPKWFSKLTTNKNQVMKKPSGIFGIELKTLLEMSGTSIPLLTESDYLVQLPQLVNSCCNHILTYGSTTVGIFRINGNNKRMENLQKQFCNDPNLSLIDSSEFTPHDVAGVLTRFLSHLPTPLIPPNFYDPLRYTWLYLDKEDDRIEGFVDCLSRLPYPHRHLLMYLLNFLKLLSLNENITQMGIGNLSSIFQPNILSHPQHLLQPKEYLISQKVVEFLISNHGHFLKVLSTEYDLSPNPRASRSSLAMRDLSTRRRGRSFVSELSHTRSMSFVSGFSQKSMIGDRSSFSITSDSSSSLSSFKSHFIRQSIISTTSCPPLVKNESFNKRNSKFSSKRFGGWWDQMNQRFSLGRSNSQISSKS